MRYQYIIVRKNQGTRKKKAKIVNMPASLQETLTEFRKNPIAKATLGDHIFDKYAPAQKKTEWDAYRISVTDREVDNYI